jgi:hypothetical protein
LGRTRLQAQAIGGNPIATLATPQTAAAWASTNPVLALNTLGAESDTLKFKVGDGVAHWGALPYTGNIQFLPVAPGPVPGHEAQVEVGISMMSEGAYLERTPGLYPTTNPSGDLIWASVADGDWALADAAYWTFTPAADGAIGAAGFFLDWWGRLLQVPRAHGESDAAYAQRIPITVMRPGTTNVGMAMLIDQLLGTTGTVVIDAQTYFSAIAIRLNDYHRMNDAWRLGPSMIFGVTVTWNCFFVLLAATGYASDVPNILAQIDQVKAAGNRMIAILDPSGVIWETTT